MRSTLTRLNPTLRTLLALGATALVGSPAAAAGLGDSCEQPTDCDEGLSCEVVGATGCACASPSPGDPADGGAPFVPPECDCPEPVEFKACVPGPCESDADCGAGLVCATWEEPCLSTRPAVPCSSEDPDCNGAPPPEEECTPTTYSVCAPRWILPCEAASDCGAGFACEPVEQCSCSGGGGTPVDPVPPEGGGSDSGSGGSGDSEGAPYYDEPECTCTPSEENWCRPVEVTCSSDADCSDGWACQDAGYDDAPCATPVPEPSGDGFAPPDPNCGAPSDSTETVGLCQPQGWGGWYGGERGESSNDENTSAPTLPTPGDGTTPTAINAEGSQAGTEGTRAAGGGCAGGELPAWFALAGIALITRRRLMRTSHAG